MIPEGRFIHISGIVQGVGFRPFVYNLAQRCRLTGWVRNTSAGVEIAVEGAPADLEAFVRALTAEAPPLAQIDACTVVERPVEGLARFTIIPSSAVAGAFQPISPDVAICDDCLRELFDPADRRYRYPFINCTNCGPRFTIITGAPYDRPLTTMADFPLCPDCRAEYDNPADRRFHAQPVACPVCGPHVWLEQRETAAPAAQGEAALGATRRLLAAGQIAAVKGLGGFHLACNAEDAAAVARLRARKQRGDKPFALMLPDLATVERYCVVEAAARTALLDRARPIVVLERRPDAPLAAAIAPGQTTVGVMLPYTPLHHLLFAPDSAEETPLRALVMTSGNRSEEPIAIDNAEARERLAALADAFLFHNRPIHVRCDDSVAQIGPSAVAGTGRALTFLRRSRGYAPQPVTLARPQPAVLAVGAELKNTFCLTRDRYAFLSQHIGDLENYETERAFEEGIAHFERLFAVRPELLAYDLHPDYLATRYALARARRDGLSAVGVQHHHAHIAAVMAEHGLPDEPVLGVAFDGTGYGTDGRIWGGEFLLCDYAQYSRPAHLRNIPLPGGEQAVREPWRVALAWLLAAGIDPEAALGDVPAEARRVVARLIATGLNAPLTSSMGRLFDAVAALLGVRHTVTYEAQAAIELETLARRAAPTAVYPFDRQGAVIDPLPLIRAVVADRARGLPVPQIAANFHAGVAALVVETVAALQTAHGRRPVVLSGGVWQNQTLLTQTVGQLRRNGYTVLLHAQTPANDGGLALGQAVVAGRSAGGR